MKDSTKTKLYCQLNTLKYFLSFWQPKHHSTIVFDLLQIQDEVLLKQVDIKEMRTLYISYLKEMRDLYLSYGISHPIAVSDLFSKTLGAFSKTGAFQAKYIYYKYNYYWSLIGPRMMQGTGACRHVASLFNDFGRLFPLAVSPFNCNLGGKAGEKKICNHLANLVQVNGKKIVVDCINRKNYLFQTEEKLVRTDDSSKILWLSEKRWYPQDKDLLLLPSLSKEEYQEEIEKLKDTSVPMDKVMRDIYDLNQRSRLTLAKISQIEENHSVPVYQKK